MKRNRYSSTIIESGSEVSIDESDEEISVLLTAKRSKVVSSSPILQLNLNSNSKSKFDPFHHSNTNAKAGASGLKQTQIYNNNDSNKNCSSLAKGSSRSINEFIEPSNSISPTPTQVSPQPISRSVTVEVLAFAAPKFHASQSKQKQKQREKESSEPLTQRPQLFEENAAEEYTQQSLRHQQIIKEAARVQLESQAKESQVKNKSSQRNGRAKDKEENGMRAGSIEEVVLVNFNCHTNFSIEFKKGINFVCGENGSGKSSILDALMYLLGGKAVDAARGPMKDRIQNTEGQAKQSATISVRLSNRGNAAYYPEKFGKSITIERRINSSGTTVWRILDDQGKSQGSTSSLVRDIMESYELHIKNSLCFLTQELAKNFYANLTPKGLYSFWIEATGLSKLESNIEYILDNRGKINNYIEQHKEVHQELKVKEKDCEVSVKQASRLVSMRNKLKEVEAKLGWKKARDLEQNLKKTREEYDETRTEFTDLEAEIKVKTAKMDEFSNARQLELKNQLASESNVRNCDESFQLLRDRLNMKHKDKKKLENSMYSLARDLVDQQENLESANQAYQSILNAQTKEVEETETNQKLQYLRSERSIVENKLSEKKDELSKAEAIDEPESKDDFDIQLQEARRNLRKKEDDLRNVQGSISQPINRFSAGMSNFLAAIDAEKRWKVKPIGPVGNFISIKNLEYAKIIEAVLGYRFSDFIVMYIEDYKLLYEIKATFGKQLSEVGIIHRKEDKTWKIRAQPADNILTLYRALSFSNDEVRRYLVDGAAIQFASLVIQRPDGDKLMRFNVSDKTHIKSCYSADGYKLGGGMIGASGSIAIDITKRLLLGKFVNATDVSGIKQSIATTTASISRLMKEQKECQDSERKASTERRKRLETLRTAVRIGIQDLQAFDTEINDLTDDSNLLSAEQEKIENSQQIKEAEATIQLTIETQQSTQAKLDEVNAEVKDLRIAHTQLNEMLENLKIEASKFDSILEDLALKISRAKKPVVQSEKNLCDVRTKLDQLKVQVTKANLSTTEAFGLANELAEEVEVTESEINLLASLSRLEIDIDSFRLDPGFNQEAADDEYYNIRARVDNAAQAINDLTLYSLALLNAAEKRESTFAKLKVAFTNSAKLQYTAVIYQHLNLDAKLQIDHEKEEIKIKIERPGGRGALSNKSLSGGEKSLEQLLLMISLWKTVSSPVRILDEYSVFQMQKTN